MEDKQGLPGDEIVRRIEKALARDGAYTWDDLKSLVLNGDAQIFFSEHGAWITQIVQAPQLRYLHVWVVAGELPEVMDLQPQVIGFARANGCAYVTATARNGWKNVAKAHGWTQNSILIAHEVPAISEVA